MNSSIDNQLKLNLEILGLYKKSPITFIRDMWKLTPQTSDTFIKGSHISKDQMQILLAVENALAGKAPRRISIRSGHGTGKSCTLAWLVLWFLFSFKDAQVPCTAPTSEQMYDVLWKEIAKWLRKMPDQIQQLYEWSSSYVRMVGAPATWFARAKTARKEAPEALAGVHGDHVMFLIDEASGVPEEIFNTAEGALTEENILVIMISNPTRLMGYFYDSHHSDRENWQTLHFDSSYSPLVDHKFVNRILEKHGMDSDEYKIRVLGEFPREDALDDKGFAPLLKREDIHETIDGEMATRTLKMGIDPSGEGRDETIWVVRDRFKAKIVAREKVSSPKTIAQKTLTLMEFYEIPGENIFVDNFGVGANVAQEMGLAGVRVHAINVGVKADDEERFRNLRAESFYRIKEWLRQGGELVKNEGWKELLYIKFKRNLKGLIEIMSKDMMRKEGIPSPNIADALMLTFIEEDAHYKVQVTQNQSFDRYSVV